MLNQRVNIQYSIDIEELPFEVKRLIKKAHELTSELEKEDFTNLASITPGGALSLSTLQDVDIVRKKIAAVDYVLNDVSSIINGFLDFKIKESQPAQEQAPPRQPPPPVMPELSPESDIDPQLYEKFNSIQDRLTQFRDKTKPHSSS